MSGSSYHIGQRQTRHRRYGWLVALMIFLIIAAVAAALYISKLQNHAAPSTLELTNQPDTADTLVYPDK